MTKHITITIIALFFFGMTVPIPAKAQSSPYWRIMEETDAMTGEIDRYIVNNVFEIEGSWDFPYDGVTALMVYRCKKPRLYLVFSNDIPYQIEWTGRISYDGKVEPTRLYQSDTGQGLFLTDFNRNVVREGKYKKIKIELASSRSGTIYLTFNVSGSKEAIAKHCSK